MKDMMDILGVFRSGLGGQMLLCLLAMVLTGLALAGMMPLFSRYALARPNARSSHKVPTPQGGGIAFITIALLVGMPLAISEGTAPAAPLMFCLLVLAMVFLGGFDDIHPLNWRVRLGIQAVLVAGVLWLMPGEWRIAPAFPLIVERGFALLLGVWFVNLTNFMDGIDGILVVGFLPMMLALGTGFLGLLPPDWLALAFAGALAGFFMVNRPPARLFAGDAGALATGLLAASLLFMLAARHSLVAAIILPLYFGMDATFTLLMRWRKGKTLTDAHRDHAYQKAVDGGISVWMVITRIAGLNVFLAVLAGLSIARPETSLPALLVASLATATLIWQFRRAKA
jgi:UDP-N-acetylmuramyl pentapeptide phosphotransferase/UDP-N-acetylglucosamine-1-phosphate transferase